jgi:23S rRNA-/tRNA-specific pseudouridylate synthase
MMIEKEASLSNQAPSSIKNTLSRQSPLQHVDSSTQNNKIMHEDSSSLSSAHLFLTNLSKQRSITHFNITSYVQSNHWITNIAATSSSNGPAAELVVHVDDCIVVCNQPSGLLCVPGLYHRELNVLQYVSIGIRKRVQYKRRNHNHSRVLPFQPMIQVRMEILSYQKE